MNNMFQKFKESSLWIGARFVAFLPIFIHRFIEHIIYFVLYKVVGYRLSVVRANLKRSFSTYSDAKLKEIEVNFYKHLADLILETICLSSYSKKEITDRMKYRNLDEVERVVKGKVGIVVSAHYASWEHSIALPLTYSGRFYGVYHPLSSSSVNKFFLRFRSTFGLVPLAMADVAKSIVTDVRNETSALYGLIADQTPPRPNIKKWIMFLDQPTPFIMGPEKLAVKYNLPIFFLDLKKSKRGFYEGVFIPIFDGLEKLPEYEITKRYARALEKVITEEPHLWMWSHKRWKHSPRNADDIV